MEYRIEHDSMGEVKVPANVYWAAQTERSHENFNIGVGMVLTVAPEDADKAIAILKAHGEDAYRLGTIVDGDGVELV